MRKTFKLDELDCANCGAKIEAGIKQIEGVNNAKVTFMTQKLMIDADDARSTRSSTKLKRLPTSSSPTATSFVKHTGRKLPT